MPTRSAGVSRPLSTDRWNDFSRRDRPAASAFSSTSTATTRTPDATNTSAMPAPMVPRPTTPTRWMLTHPVCRTGCSLPEVVLGVRVGRVGGEGLRLATLERPDVHALDVERSVAAARLLAGQGQHVALTRSEVEDLQAEAAVAA